MAASNTVARVNQILRGHGMAGQGKWLVYYANHYHVDLGLMVGIAGAETTWGDAGTGVRGQYNPFGFMHNGPGTGYTFGSYKEAISKMAKLLRSRYYAHAKPGKANPQAMMMEYVGYFSHDWVTTASKYANTLAGGKGGKVPKGGGRRKAVPKGTYVLPVPTKMGSSSEFSYVDAEGAPDRNGTRHHAGKDWFGVEGGLSPVFAPVAGKVIESKQAVTWSGQVMGGTIKIQAADGKVFVFRHTIPGLKEGQRVQAGQQIARIGKWTDGADHVHIEIWKSLGGGYRYENMIDPVEFFTHHKTIKPGQVGSFDEDMPDAPGMPPSPKEDKGFKQMYQPHFGQDFAMTGILGSPGQDPITDPGREPAGIARMWQGIASLPNASSESMLFANRARSMRGY